MYLLLSLLLLALVTLVRSPVPIPVPKDLTAVNGRLYSAYVSDDTTLYLVRFKVHDSLASLTINVHTTLGPSVGAFMCPSSLGITTAAECSASPNRVEINSHDDIVEYYLTPKEILSVGIELNSANDNLLVFAVSNGSRYSFRVLAAIILDDKNIWSPPANDNYTGLTRDFSYFLCDSKSNVIIKTPVDVNFRYSDDESDLYGDRTDNQTKKDGESDGNGYNVVKVSTSGNEGDMTSMMPPGWMHFSTKVSSAQIKPKIQVYSEEPLELVENKLTKFTVTAYRHCYEMIDLRKVMVGGFNSILAFPTNASRFKGLRYMDMQLNATANDAVVSPNRTKESFLKNGLINREILNPNFGDQIIEILSTAVYTPTFVPERLYIRSGEADEWLKSLSAEFYYFFSGSAYILKPGTAIENYRVELNTADKAKKTIVVPFIRNTNTDLSGDLPNQTRVVAPIDYAFYVITKEGDKAIDLTASVAIDDLNGPSRLTLVSFKDRDDRDGGIIRHDNPGYVRDGIYFLRLDSNKALDETTSKIMTVDVYAEKVYELQYSASYPVMNIEREVDDMFHFSINVRDKSRGLRITVTKDEHDNGDICIALSQSEGNYLPSLDINDYRGCSGKNQLQFSLYTNVDAGAGGKYNLKEGWMYITVEIDSGFSINVDYSDVPPATVLRDGEWYADSFYSNVDNDDTYGQVFLFDPYENEFGKEMRYALISLDADKDADINMAPLGFITLVSKLPGTEGTKINSIAILDPLGITPSASSEFNLPTDDIKENLIFDSGVEEVVDVETGKVRMRSWALVRTVEDRNLYMYVRCKGSDCSADGNKSLKYVAMATSVELTEPLTDDIEDMGRTRDLRMNGVPATYIYNLADNTDSFLLVGPVVCVGNQNECPQDDKDVILVVVSCLGFISPNVYNGYDKEVDDSHYCTRVEVSMNDRGQDGNIHGYGKIYLDSTRPNIHEGTVFVTITPRFMGEGRNLAHNFTHTFKLYEYLRIEDAFTSTSFIAEYEDAVRDGTDLTLLTAILPVLTGESLVDETGKPINKDSNGDQVVIEFKSTQPVKVCITADPTLGIPYFAVGGVRSTCDVLELVTPSPGGVYIRNIRPQFMGKGPTSPVYTLQGEKNVKDPMPGIINTVVLRIVIYTVSEDAPVVNFRIGTQAVLHPSTTNPDKTMTKNVFQWFFSDPLKYQFTKLISFAFDISDIYYDEAGLVIAPSIHDHDTIPEDFYDKKITTYISATRQFPHGGSDETDVITNGGIQIARLAELPETTKHIGGSQYVYVTVQYNDYIKIDLDDTISSPYEIYLDHDLNSSINKITWDSKATVTNVVTDNIHVVDRHSVFIPRVPTTLTISPCRGSPIVLIDSVKSEPTIDGIRDDEGNVIDIINYQSMLSGTWGKELVYTIMRNTIPQVNWFLAVYDGLLLQNISNGELEEKDAKTIMAYDIFVGSSDPRPRLGKGGQLIVTNFSSAGDGSVTVKFMPSFAYGDDSSIISYSLYAIEHKGNNDPINDWVPTTACGMLNGGHSIYMGPNGEDYIQIDVERDSDGVIKTNYMVQMTSNLPIFTNGKSGSYYVTVIAATRTGGSIAYNSVVVGSGALGMSACLAIASCTALVLVISMILVFFLVYYRRAKKAQGYTSIFDDVISIDNEVKPTEDPKLNI